MLITLLHNKQNQNVKNEEKREKFLFQNEAERVHQCFSVVAMGSFQRKLFDMPQQINFTVFHQEHKIVVAKAYYARVLYAPVFSTNFWRIHISCLVFVPCCLFHGI